VTQLAARILFSALFAALLIISRADPARAQSNSVSVYKEICSPTLSACGVASVTPGAAVTYRVSLANLTVGALSVDLQENFPPGFHLFSASCGNVPLTQTAVTGLTIFLGAATLPAAATPGSAGPTVECLIVGWFSVVTGAYNNANNQVSVVDHATRLTNLGASNNINASVSVPGSLPTDLSILKTAPTSVDISTGPQTLQYAITISNTGANASDVFLGPFFTLQDRLSIPPTSVPLIATFAAATGCTSVPASGASSGSDCLNLVPSAVQSPLTLSAAGADFVQWKYPPGSQGLLRAGGSIVLTYQVTIAPVPGMTCQKQINGDRVLNRAFIALVAAPLVAGGPTTVIGETNPANNTTAAATSDVQVTTGALVTDPLCGEAPSVVLQLVKSQTPVNPTAGFPWPTTVTYRLELKNLSQTRTISNIKLHDPGTHSLGDLVQERLGTPPFRATFAGILCSTSICSGNAWPSGLSQQLSGYNDVKWMFGTTVYSTSTTHLAAGEIKSFNLKMKFSNPACDSYPAIGPKPIGNTFVATYQDVLQGTSIPITVTVESNRVITLMAKPAGCNLQVWKSVNSPTSKVIFGQPFSYTVKFKNPGLQPQTYGTLRDVMRTTAGYATSLSVDYQYTCGPSPAGSVTGFPGSTLTTGTVPVSNTSLPQQGVAIIQNTTPVTFQPGAGLTCNVTVKVARPSPSDQYCANMGKLENAAFADTSASYNSSIQWPPNTTPGNFATVSLPLPRCFNLVVNKSVVNPPPPPWTSVNGGPITYDVMVTNFGPPIAGTLGAVWNGPVLTDAFSSPSPFTTPVFASVKVGSTVTCAWSVASPCGWLVSGSGPPSLTFPTPFNPSWMAIRKLSTGQTMTTRFTAANPYPPPPAQVCNEAVVSMSGLDPDDWYWKDPNTLQSHVCVPVLKATFLTVKKTTANSAPSAPPLAAFTVAVTCARNNVPYGPNVTLTFNYPPDPPSQVVQTVPIGSVCTIGEAPPPAPVSWPGCNSGFAAWAPPSYPNPVGPDNTPQSVSIQDNPNNTLIVHNTFDCLTTGSVTVKKRIIRDTVDVTSQQEGLFQVEVACTNPNSLQTATLSLANQYQAVVSGILVGSQCTVTELLPQSPSVLPPGKQWVATYTPDQHVTVQSGNQTVALLNEMVSNTVPPDQAFLIVEKSFEIFGAIDPNHTMTFHVNVSCTGVNGGAPQLLTMTPTFVVYQTGTVYVAYSAYVSGGVPVGSTCWVTEPTLPQMSSNLSQCSWAAGTPSYLHRDYLGGSASGPTVTLSHAQREYKLMVFNQLVCPP
jgi:hypothetical protein